MENGWVVMSLAEGDVFAVIATGHVISSHFTSQ